MNCRPQEWIHYAYVGASVPMKHIIRVTFHSIPSAMAIPITVSIVILPIASRATAPRASPMIVPSIPIPVPAAASAPAARSTTVRPVLVPAVATARWTSVIIILTIVSDIPPIIGVPVVVMASSRGMDMRCITIGRLVRCRMRNVLSRLRLRGQGDRRGLRLRGDIAAAPAAPSLTGSAHMAGIEGSSNTVTKNYLDVRSSC